MDFENVLNENLAKELISALLSGKDFSYAKDGLTINASAGDDSINLSCIYKPELDKNKEVRENFYKFCDEMDEDLFVEVCENIPNLSEVNERIESIEPMEGINTFMNTLQQVVLPKVDRLNKEIEEVSESLNRLKEIRNDLIKYIG